MTEKLLNTKKNGMVAMLINLAVLVLSIVGLVFGIITTEADPGSVPGIVLCVVSAIVLVLGWIPLCGLKVLKPQEALVLTLFGNYIGTLKGEGFYWVNPFCTAVNPAADTKLNQSGDVKQVATVPAASGSTSVEVVDKRLSLKIMTLNNNRQKILHFPNV